jgi:hypothetical protein
MNPLKTLALAFLMLACSGQAIAGSARCFDHQGVVQINAGYVEIYGLGPDGGDAVYFKLENGQTFPLAAQYNLDWARGQALHKMLMTALTSGYKITGYDHSGTLCDDIDEIAIHR